MDDAQPAAAAKSIRRGRRELNKQAKLERIRAAARDLFRKQGFEKTTTQEIAVKAGVGGGTVFLYAPRKEDLLVLAFSADLDEVAAEASRRIDPNAPFEDQALAFFSRLLDYHRRNVALSRALLREAAFLRDPSSDYGLRAMTLLDNLIKLVARAQQRGEISMAMSPRLAARLLFSAYWLKLRDWVNGWGDDEDFHSELQMMIKTLVDGFRGDVGERPERTPVKRSP